VGFIEDLEKTLGHKVDVVTEGMLHWSIREEVLREAKPI
jgi:predicted nucleotidyltransferase